MTERFKVHAWKACVRQRTPSSNLGPSAIIKGDVMEIGHELRPTGDIFESYESLDEEQVDLQNKEIFNQCARSVFESVGPYTKRGQP